MPTSLSSASSITRTSTNTTALPSLASGLRSSTSSSTNSTPSTNVISSSIPTSQSESALSSWKYRHRRERLDLGIGLGIGIPFVSALVGLAACLASIKRRKKRGSLDNGTSHALDETQDMNMEEGNTSELPAEFSVPELSGTHDRAELASRHERHVSDTSMLDSIEIPAELSFLSDHHDRPLSLEVGSFLDGTTEMSSLNPRERPLSSDVVSVLEGTTEVSGLSS